MIFYHIALRSEWESALGEGVYRISTRGKTVADEGFLHGSFEDQIQPVADTFYADLDEPVVLLRVDGDRCGAAVLVEDVPGVGAFPHLYGDLPVEAVVAVLPYERDPQSGLFGEPQTLPGW